MSSYINYFISFKDILNYILDSCWSHCYESHNCKTLWSLVFKPYSVFSKRGLTFTTERQPRATIIAYLGKVCWILLTINLKGVLSYYVLGFF